MVVDLYEEIVKLRTSGKRGALATIVETQGSTPRKPGAKMLISEDGNAFGTIGGGKLESRVMADARECIKTGKPTIREFKITEKSKKESGMICGGKMKVFVEPLNTPESVVIFGGGHVGYAVFEICRILGLPTIVTDDRKEFANKKRFPGADSVLCLPFKKQFERLQIDRNTYVVIATRRHEADELCLRNVIKTKAKYIGMLGSRTKCAAIKKRLLDSGVRPAALRRVHCPIGLDIGAITPEEIAVSIAAELIQCRAGKL
jgi:xanthine dehydrogenase accessory factor